MSSYYRTYHRQNAMQVVGLDEDIQIEVLRLVAAVLHIGNISFVEKSNYAAIANDDCE